MVKIYVNDKNAVYPPYEFKIIEINCNFINIETLLVYLLQNYSNDFDNYMDYTFYKINNVSKFKWSWNYLGLLNNNLSLIQNSENIDNLSDIYVHYHHSQHEEDCIIKRVFNSIKCTNKVFVDVGSKDGKFVSNVYDLIKQGWSGLLIDPIADTNLSNDKLTFIKGYAFPDNLKNLLDLNNIPLNFDFLNIDIDGNDIHLLISIMDKYKPRLICIETNSRNNYFKIERFFEYKSNNNMDKQASILSIMKILKNNYTLVYNNAGNCFFIKNPDMVHLKKLEYSEIINNIKNCIKNISDNESNTTTHQKDKESLLNVFNDYINNGFEQHYPYILRYNL